MRKIKIRETGGCTDVKEQHWKRGNNFSIYRGKSGSSIWYKQYNQDYFVYQWIAVSVFIHSRFTLCINEFGHSFNKLSIPCLSFCLTTDPELTPMIYYSHVLCSTTEQQMKFKTVDYYGY